jgi:hypothetical protein
MEIAADMENVYSIQNKITSKMTSLNISENEVFNKVFKDSLISNIDFLQFALP